jgi:hypothetical protein
VHHHTLLFIDNRWQRHVQVMGPHLITFACRVKPRHKFNKIPHLALITAIVRAAVVLGSRQVHLS